MQVVGLVLSILQVLGLNCSYGTRCGTKSVYTSIFPNGGSTYNLHYKMNDTQRTCSQSYLIVIIDAKKLLQYLKNIINFKLVLENTSKF
jgi:hypothetical protein